MLQEISKEVWHHNYQAPNETSVEETWKRQAITAASIEREEIRQSIENDFYWLLEDFKGIAGGRITANLGVEGREGTTLMNCFIAGTKVFTTTGYKNIEEINVGDFVLTHTGNYRRVHNTLNRKYKGTVNRFSDSSLLNDIIVTPEHPFFTKDNAWELACNVDHLVFAKTQDSTDLQYIQYDDNNIMISNDVAYLFGRFIGDGCIFHNGNKDHYDYNSFNIAFASTEVESMNRLRSIFESTFNISVNINSHDSQQVSYIRKYNPVFASFIRDNIGTNAHNKRIPEFIFTSPLHIQKSFLLGLFDADGFIQSNKVLRIDLANENLINDIMLLGRFQGINFRKKKLNNKLSKHDTYSLCASSNSSYDFYTNMSKTYNDDRMEIKKDANNAYKFKSINDNVIIYTDSEEEYFDGVVYNISVEIDESYVVNNIIVHNCFVHNPRDLGYKDPDSINGIYDMLKAQALTLKSEGGYGMNFSWIRPAGMYVRGIDSRTPGVVQMMSLWNQSSSVITMGSDKILGETYETEKKKIRKGAQMGVLEIWHPEIEDFIDAKLVQGQLNKFNISVGITDGFMEAVISDGDWELKFPDTMHPEYGTKWNGNIAEWESNGYPVTVYAVVKARTLWDKIMKATYTRNDPGVLFLDLANKLNALSYAEKIATTNPCGEIAMSTGVCNLMSLNLVKFIKKGSDGKMRFDYETFKKAVSIAVRFSDNINDISRAPLDEYKSSMVDKRRIGLGVLSLGSLHYMMGIRFGSPESLELIESIMKCKAESEITASAILGVEKGSFKLFDANQYFNTYWWKNLDLSDEFKKGIESIGAMRNSHRSANAPTGNMSIYCGVVSGGIEPVFMQEYVRWAIVPEKDRAELKKQGLKFPEAPKGEWFETDVFKFSKRGTDDILKGTYNGVDYEIDKGRGLIKASLVSDYGWLYAKENFTASELAEMESKGVFATTEDLSVADHINPLKIIAKYTDMSSSKTVNLPADYPYEEFKNLYIDSWKAGIKGITTYRAGTMTAVLEKKQETKDQQVELENMFSGAKDGVILENVKLPSECHSKLYVIKDKNKKKWYVNIAFADQGLTRPFALFVNTNSKESNEVAEDTIESLMKLAKNKGINKTLIGDQLEKYLGQTNVTKIARAIGFLLRHNIAIIDIVDVLDEGNYPISSFTFHVKRLLKQFIKDGTNVSGKNGKCPQCGGTMIFQEGCILCKDCSFSKCN